MPPTHISALPLPAHPHGGAAVAPVLGRPGHQHLGAGPRLDRAYRQVVDDADQVRADFGARGLDVGEVDELPWGRFLYFKDPDGNAWNVQQIVRGRATGAT